MPGIFPNQLLKLLELSLIVLITVLEVLTQSLKLDRSVLVVTDISYWQIITNFEPGSRRLDSVSLIDSPWSTKIIHLIFLATKCCITSYLFANKQIFDELLSHFRFCDSFKSCIWVTLNWMQMKKWLVEVSRVRIGSQNVTQQTWSSPGTGHILHDSLYFEALPWISNQENLGSVVIGMTSFSFHPEYFRK